MTENNTFFILEMTENNTQVTSQTQNIDFISSTSYKIGQKFNKKLTLLT